MDRLTLKEDIERYLSTETGASTSVVELDEINMGWETELFTFKTENIEGESDLVLRVFSGKSAGKKASKEFDLMKRLGELGYPVPEVYYLDVGGGVIGKPFIVMERLMGGTLDSHYNSYDEAMIQESINKLMGLLVNLHGFDASLFSGLPHLETVSIKDQIDDYRRACASKVPWLSSVIDWLEENKPDKEYLALCHNDFHGMNVMMDTANKAYVIDWGAVRICDPRSDLAWTILLYSTFGGPMFREPIIKTYNRLGGYTDSLKFFEVLAATRRIVDLTSVVSGKGTYGLRPDVLELMKEQRDHFKKVHDYLEEITGIRLTELDKILEEF